MPTWLAACVLAVSLALAGCSRQDTQKTEREAGRAAYKASQKVKQAAKKAAHEVGQAAREAHRGWKEAEGEQHKK